MIRFEYDPQLVEQATFLAARKDADKECALHEMLDPLYAIPDMELRQRAFRAAYGDMFRRLGLDQILPGYTSEFLHMTKRLTRCLVREAERTRAQNVDLYKDKTSDAAGQVLIIAICPDFFLNATRLRPWMYRQLQHVEDMLDENFAYDRELPELPKAQQNLVRDRYAVLWDIFVEGRLFRSGKIDDQGIEGLWLSFHRAFMHEGLFGSPAHFEKLLNATTLTHANLLSWAQAPALLLGNVEGESNESIMVEEMCAVS